ncbi:MAG TPA: hypothetical protein VFZ21_26370 [Gemmatimonadaceae bacterium]|jgi:hypothetical protein|nr:hypothetical protein [Gemmatimonadaceae bacterium]
MFPVVLALALAFDQEVRVRIGSKPDSADKAARVLADTIDRDRDRPRRQRIPVTPELEASAFRDANARELLAKAREARMRQDSALLSYDATAYQRLSAGLGFRAIGRDRLLFRTENASRVRWSRDNGAWVDLKGARTVLPMVKDEGEVDVHEMSPIPYYPGREALWIGSGVAKAEVDPEDMIHPLAIGSEAYYRFATGDSITFTLSDGKTIALRELRIEPRRPNWRLSVGSFWFDVSSGQLVRAAYRMSVEMDIWQVVEEEEEDDEVPAVAKAIMSPMRANLEAVTIDYGLYGGRFWLPRVQAAQGSAQVGFMRVPFKMEESFKYASVNGTDSVPPLPPSPKSLRDSLFGDSTRWRDLSREERRERAKRIAEADSVRREQQRVSRKAQCDTSGTYVTYESRYNGAVRTAMVIPCDSTVLARSPDLPASIYEPGEELFGVADREELLKALDFSLQPGWAPQKPQLRYGLSMTRYNRVEGLSTGLGVTQELGRGYRLGVVPRFGLADKELNGELFAARTNGRRVLQVGGYRRLAASNDWGDPLGFGSSLNAVLFGIDEGFYYRTLGGELTGSNVDGGGFTWRLFAEQHRDADVETQFSLAHSLNDVRFLENIEATRGTVGGVGMRYTRTFGLDPAGWRLLTDVRAEAATGTFDYTRGAFDATVSRGLGGSLAAALTASAGTSGGTLPPQRAWFIGGAHTVRGQRPSLTLPGQAGNSYWLGRAEVGYGMTAVRPTIFGDIGWAGDRSSWSHPGRPVSGAGVGFSFLDGLFRVDVSRGISPRKRTLLDFYFEARF